ncbi:MAG: glutamate-5-semialdehyde dehydrogenase [Candidatus Omnitrophica bacterium]|nr:glutamate-5-semialdehyde dehydrogenase [Candidatus Omnitrophota bacterium]
MDIQKRILKIAQAAKKAAVDLAALDTNIKNRALRNMSAALSSNIKEILGANQKDVALAGKKGLSASIIDRLSLNDKRVAAMRASLEQVASLPDPVGEVIKETLRPNGLKIRKVRVPIGVIGIIYESRPDVTADCAGLCLKSGNAVILRGGSEALNSNRAIFNTLNNAALESGIPQGCLNMILFSDKSAVDAMLTLDKYIDLIIPRGGEALIKKIAAKSRIPVIKHYKGVCHVYIDSEADLNMAQRIAFNAKVQRPGVCNAMETLLVHKDVAARFLPGMIKQLAEAGVEIRGDELTRRIVRGLKRAQENDWSEEYLGLILSVRVVDSLEEAIRHINKYGSGHSESIVTDDEERARVFFGKVDSACLYLNASTRFTDGYEFGMGAEIGISTDKLHARGPMALEELTTYKYTIYGSGQVRA